MSCIRGAHVSAHPTADEAMINLNASEVQADAVTIECEVVLGGKPVDGVTVVVTR